VNADEKRRHLLTLLYDWKTAPENERAAAKRLLDAALDEARKDTPFSREDIKDYLMAEHYKQYFVQRKRSENAGMH
jgi:hypothetical protein